MSFNKKEYNKLYQQKNKEEIQKKHREWVARNKEKQQKYHKEYNKRWYQENMEDRKKHLKEYAQNHKSDSVKRVQKYVSLHKEKVKQYNKEFNQTVAGRYRMLLYRAKKWGKPYLSLEDFIELDRNPCAYCGDSEKSRGIDRIDNSKGYTKDNSASCCKICNYMKKAMKKDDFLSHVEKINRFNQR